MVDPYIKALASRVKMVRIRHAGPRGKRAFAAEVDISLSSYGNYEKTRAAPIDALLKICEVTGTDLIWLLTGNEPLQDTSASTVAKIFHEANIPILRKLDELLAKNPDLAGSVAAFLELLSEKNVFEKQADSTKPPVQMAAKRQSSKKPPKKTVAGKSRKTRADWIPILGRTAAGLVHFWDEKLVSKPEQAITELDELVKKYTGRKIIKSSVQNISIDLQERTMLEGLTNMDANLIQVGGAGPEQIAMFVQCEQVYKLFPDSFALYIDGDSMSPRINDSDIVIVSPSVPAVQGQAAIVRVANQIGVTCKLIRSDGDSVHLVPINERYEAKIVANDDLLWALAVLCHLSL